MPKPLEHTSAPDCPACILMEEIVQGLVLALHMTATEGAGKEMHPLDLAACAMIAAFEHARKDGVANVAYRQAVGRLRQILEKEGGDMMQAQEARESNRLN